MVFQNTYRPHELRNPFRNIQSIIPPAALPRPWISLAKQSPKGRKCIFTVMSYNVLCNSYATQKKYGFCPSWALDWEYRKMGILDELRRYGADIINLQEVQMEHFYDFFLPELQLNGYSGIYAPKSRARYMPDYKRKLVDGCAIFFKTNKFTLIKEHLIEFNQLAIANSNGLEHMLNRVMPKDNVGLAALLQTTDAAWKNAPTDGPLVQQTILVCNSHIHWDPEFCDVKLIQTMMLSKELKNIIEKSAEIMKTSPENIQLVLCGDFNSLPDSGVVEFLCRGRVSRDHRDFKDLSYKQSFNEEDVTSCEKSNEFTHSFKLASAYDTIMPFTNYTFDFKGEIDYIFYTTQTMTPLGVLGPPPLEWFMKNNVLSCPNQNVFSDHFPLLVELEMVPTSLRFQRRSFW